MKFPDTVNIIDVEATCWDNQEDWAGQPNEIIEIGIAEVGLSDLIIKRNTRIYVKPTKSTISKFCTTLTGITPNLINTEGISFLKATHTLKTSFRLHKRIWISWGDYDKDQFQRDCDRNNLEYKRIFFKRHLNFKTIFAVLHNLPKEFSVGEALDFLNLKFEGKQHSGKDDAYNIARIYIHTLKQFRTNKNI